MPADDPDIWEEQLSRNKQFFAERCVMTEKGKTWEAHDGQADIEDASVVVVGLGGVGSHAAHMLARAGIKRLRLIDFDQVTLSSLNRHAVADRADVGKPKVVVCAEHFASSIRGAPWSLSRGCSPRSPQRSSLLSRWTSRTCLGLHR